MVKGEKGQHRDFKDEKGLVRSLELRGDILSANLTERILGVKM